MQPLTPQQVNQIRRLTGYVRANLSLVYSPPHHTSYDNRAAQYESFILDLNEIEEQMDGLKDEYAELAADLSVEMVSEPPPEGAAPEDES